MRRYSCGLFCLLFASLSVASSGCLSLGGRTTYVQEKPETLARVTALETRVSALEQAVSISPLGGIPLGSE
jgi:hypothetical protein